MSQPAKYWASSIFLDALAFSLLYLWQVEGIDRAGAVFQFVAWALTLITLFGAYLVNAEHVTKHPRPKGFEVYHFASEVAILAALIWVDMTILASIRLFAVLAFESSLNEAKKDAA